ncbi:LysM peptidoglycan-binding domain-containing protein [Flavobacterium humi]|uniref:LysM peptidoglycan-binding domain-containing protein n=1 Tax=Flavobacterium humi TaxID=2562683 RepID=A0A4Z0L9U1_9FLAO|nr:LysM peptidoglycan-binding domain-containing protein [Flavobacterium humi]TGD59091.1 LysM peptidoglycan-binding domain-containing protein [Flavobacterium humi]
MKYLLIGLVFLGLNTVFGQNLIKHKVAKGETINQISKKYNVSLPDIYKMNPDAQKGIQENTLLLIPNKPAATVAKKETKEAKETKTPAYVSHEVAPKETLFGIAKQYNVPMADIEKNNADLLKDGLKTGMILTIKGKPPVKKTEAVAVKPVVQNSSKTPVYHEVLPKETKYGIAKQYGITVEQLEKQNPGITGELPIGQKLLITGKQAVAQVPVQETVKKPEENNTYIVKPKETLYSLSAQFGITQEELIALNPELKNGVQEGMTLKVPAKTIVSLPKRDYKDLTKTFVKQGNRKLALLLPFNLTKLDQDTLNSTKARLKKDKFLNMTLDFYAGALMAIDSVNKMGVNVDVTILDSEETKSTSNIYNLIQNNNLKSMDAVIGPFYQNNAEKTAELLSQSNVPVISPLSKDYDKKYPNLIQATPSSDDIKNAMFDFMHAAGGNIVAVVDPKKMSIRQYISENHKDVQFANFNENSALDVAQLKSLLVKDKVNFVIMETERTNLILSTTTALQNALGEYQVRLVILGENEALDYEEIQMSRLTKLKMHYPSVTRVNDSEQATAFETSFKKKNRVYPNQFATRGFDVTFDVLMRLAQEKPLLETLNDAATEQVESKFYFVPDASGGYANKGVYILYYDTDLTIKEAK